MVCCVAICGIASAQAVYTLAQLKDSALNNNIAIRQAHRSIEAVQQQRKEAFTKYFPSISATGLWFNADKGMAHMDINPSEMISPQLAASMAQQLPMGALAAMQNPIGVSMLKNGTMAGVNAVQPVFAGGQIVNGNRLARVGEEAACLQLQLSENEVEKHTEEYFWQLVTLQEKLRTVTAVELMLAEIHKDVDVAVRAGVAMRNDLLQVQLRRNEVESQELKLRNAMSIVRLLLAQYCGLRDTSFVLNQDVSGIDADDGAEELQCPVFDVQTLPEYQLLDKQVKVARLQKNIAVGKNLPSVAVGAGYNYHNLLENDRSFGMVFTSVSVPISDWWGGAHAIRRSKIEYQRAQDEQRDKAELLRIRMQSAWNNVVEARQQLDIARRSIEQSEENLRLNRDYYRAGTARMTDLLEAQLLYQQSLDRRADAYAEYNNRLLEYRQSVGL